MQAPSFLPNLTRYQDNSLEDVEVSGATYVTNPQIVPSCFVALSFGEGSGYNRKIAGHVRDAYTHFEDDMVPLFAQLEVARHLRGEISGIVELGADSNPCQTGIFPRYLTTRDALKFGAEIARLDSISLDQTVLIAHPSSIHRASALAKKLGYTTTPFVPKEVEWAPNDHQWWVRGPKRAAIREVGARMHHLFRGWTDSL